MKRSEINRIIEEGIAFSTNISLCFRLLLFGLLICGQAKEKNMMKSGTITWDGI